MISPTKPRWTPSGLILRNQGGDEGQRKGGLYVPTTYQGGQELRDFEGVSRESSSHMMYVRSISMRTSERAARCGGVAERIGPATAYASALLSSAANANRAKDMM